MKMSAFARLVGMALLATAGFALTGAPAGAIDTTKPAPCNGIHVVDAAGDGEYDSSGTFPGSPVFPGAAPAPDNLEVLNLFFNYRPGSDGKKELTANITIKNMSAETHDGPGGSGGNWYYVHYTYGGVSQYVRAANQDGEFTYAYGNVSEEGVYTKEGDTTGAVFDGPEGVVQIVVPEALGGKPGETLTGAFAAADTIEGQDDFFGLNHHADLAPDESDPTAPDGKDYTVKECPPASGGGTTTTTPTTTAGPPPPAPNQPAGPTTLPFKASSTLGTARKAKKGKTLRLKVTAGKPISGLRVAVKKFGGKSPAWAQATVANLKQGTSTIKVKVKKSLKKGKYTLQAQGVVDGQASSVTQTVRVK